MSTPTVDAKDLEGCVKDVYRQVALQPERTYHFEMGRPLAERLGYPSDLLDLGSGSGTDGFAIACIVGDDGYVTGVDITDEQLAKATAS